MRRLSALNLTAALLAVGLAVVLLLGSSAAVPARAARTTLAPGSTCGIKTEVYYLPDGQDYRGVVSVSESGVPCKNWASQAPNPHDIPLDAATGVGNHSYCRNPNGLERPGCFTTTPGGGYQFCKVGVACSQSPVAKATVQFAPVSGTKMTADSSHNYVSLSCYPRPCAVHYALGAEVLASATSPVYTQPIMLKQSTTVKTYVVYESGAPMRAQARYTITPTTTPAPLSAIQFVPSDSVVYTNPVVIELLGVTSADSVLLYWGDDVMHPTVYTGGTFRLTNASTTILAVVNGTHYVSATYRVNITAPPLNVYPLSGTFVGGVAVLVNDPQPPSTYYMYVNDSTEWEPLTDMLITWTVVGTSKLDIRALHVAGVESAQSVVYEVVPALPPTVTPDPSVPHHRPVNVTCTAPLGRPLTLSVYRDAAMLDAVAEGVYWAALSTPGAFTVTCAYTDDLQVAHATTTVVELVAVPMQPQTFTPACGANFPAVPLSLQTQLNMSALLPGAAATSWSVSATATGGARIPMITRAEDVDGVFVYDVFQTRPIEVPTTMEVYVTAHSLDPLEADSARTTCAYSLYPISTAATPYFSAIPACATTSAPVSAACMTAVQLELATCLHFYSTELLSIDPLGPIVLMRMTGLAAAIQPEMYTRMGACLAAMQRSGSIAELHNETSGEMVLGTVWHVGTPTRKAAEVYTGLPLTVHITGFHADAGAYHLVRQEYGCEDIGVLPEAVLSASPYAPTEPITDQSTYMTFRIPIPGRYKLCAYMSGALYVVPFESRVVPTPSAANFLNVVVQPFPAIAATSAQECGGAVTPAMEGTAVSLALSAIPADAYPSLEYSYNSAGWLSLPFPVNAATQLGESVSMSIGPLNHKTRPLEVFDASLGPTTGSAQTCVFFVSAAAADTSAPLPTISYLFYTVNTTDVPAGLSGVMLLLQGTFQPGELIFIDIYENVTATTGVPPSDGSALRLLRHVRARPSAATAYAVALPDQVLGLPPSAQRAPYVISASLDGVAVTASPSTVALSPLSLAMTPCTTCASGLCYGGQCLCKNRRTKVVSVCGTDSQDDSSDEDSKSTSTTTTTAAPSSSSDSGDNDDVTPISLARRLTFLIAYLAMLAVIAGYIHVSIKRGGARRERATHAQDITVEAA